MNKIVETPLMKQYNQIKCKYPDAMLLFRVGDFYETFGEDAIKASKILGITLTRRANGSAAYIELAGFPHHAVDTYLPKLVRAGLRVAICDQLEDPKLTKTIVKRGVTELVTPGVSLNDNILNQKSNNYLASIYFGKIVNGISFLDVSTGEFFIAEGDIHYLDKLLAGYKPSEILVSKSSLNKFTETFGSQYYTNTLEEWIFSIDFAKDKLLNHFQTKSLKGFGVENFENGIIAAGASLFYLSETQHDKIKHISSISRLDEEQYVWLDRFTINNLEIFSSNNDEALTLINVIDNTQSSMGARLLKKWIAFPLKNIKLINERLNSVEYFIDNQEERDSIHKYISEIGDLERLISKAATGRINPRELYHIGTSLSLINPIVQICKKANDELFKISEQLNPCNSIREKIESQIIEDAPVNIVKGGVIKNGVSAELDELRNISGSGKDFLIELQNKEIEKTNIPSLKIGFNNVFGYFLEVRNTHKDKVPKEWIRKQTLTTAERYITEELKEYETKILGAEEKILTLETRLFNDLVVELSEYTKQIQLNALLISKLDCLISFAVTAIKNKYCKPNINESLIIDIEEGRHPVIEKKLPVGEEYISNNVYLNPEDQQIIVITGPNMSGKSALLRQTALITLMAQIGSYVPAKQANIGVVDKIFTRVGATDNISSGESTFMVEMNETASILNNISERSLIILDEIGRGTSTYDGISIAWAIAEFIHSHPNCKAKTLFATHYHELNEMTKTHNRIKNYNVSVKELNDKVIFMRKLVQGGSEHSFGIHVAQMAGMPKSIIKRSKEILKQLESSSSKNNLSKPVDKLSKEKEGYQLSFFQLDDPMLSQIKKEIEKTDVDTLTPVEALIKLNEIKKLLKG